MARKKTPTKRERIERCQDYIASSEQNIKAEEAKIEASRNRIKAERERIAKWKAEIFTLNGELLAETLCEKNLTLDDALAALDLQGEATP